ncbi:MAG: hypothetical protein IJ405_02550 [Lachnospiraceae bacterium]|nr:hypothetical protein [Lachnospiraceae bacterium]
MSSGIKDILTPEAVLVLGKSIQSGKIPLEAKKVLFRNCGEEIAVSYEGSAQESLIGTILTEDGSVAEIESKLDEFGSTIKIHAEDTAVINETAKNAL